MNITLRWLSLCLCAQTITPDNDKSTLRLLHLASRGGQTNMYSVIAQARITQTLRLMAWHPCILRLGKVTKTSSSYYLAVTPQTRTTRTVVTRVHCLYHTVGEAQRRLSGNVVCGFFCAPNGFVQHRRLLNFYHPVHKVKFHGRITG
jgi:hypothetical protein